SVSGHITTSDRPVDIHLKHLRTEYQPSSMFRPRWRHSQARCHGIRAARRVIEARKWPSSGEPCPRRWHGRRSGSNRQQAAIRWTVSMHRVFRRRLRMHAQPFAATTYTLLVYGTFYAAAIACLSF
ncbi:unnamed protein product, partial [Mycena citricolor]